MNYKNLFRDFEENCGWKSIVKFMDYQGGVLNKKQFKELTKKLELFQNLEIFGLVKNYNNFKKYCLNK